MTEEVKQAPTTSRSGEPVCVNRNHKIWMWNVNGIRSTLNNQSFGRFMDQAKPDILCLNETKIDDEALTKERVKEQIAKWFPMNLQFWNCAKPPKKGYSGVAIFIRKDFKGGIRLW